MSVTPKTRYLIIIETLLAIVMTLFLVLALYALATDGVTHEDLRSEIRGIQEQVSTLNCRITAEGAQAMAECDSPDGGS